MTEQEISHLLGKPFDEILYLSRYREILLAMFALVFHKGNQQGLKDAHDDMNLAFTTISITN